MNSYTLKSPMIELNENIHKPYKNIEIDNGYNISMTSFLINIRLTFFLAFLFICIQTFYIKIKMDLLTIFFIFIFFLFFILYFFFFFHTSFIIYQLYILLISCIILLVSLTTFYHRKI